VAPFLRGPVFAGHERVHSRGWPIVLGWSGAELAMAVDAVRCQPPDPRRIHRSVLIGDGYAR
jgi:hypothetical protein